MKFVNPDIDLPKLVAGITAKDTASLELLYFELRRAVLPWLIGKTKMAGTAEDFLHDIYIRLTERMYQIHNPLSFWAFVWQISYSVFAGSFRKADCKPNRFVQLEYLQFSKIASKHLTYINESDERIYATQQIRSVRAAVNELPKRYKFILNLYLSGKPSKECCEESQTGEIGFRVARRRARLLLVKQLRKTGLPVVAASRYSFGLSFEDSRKKIEVLKGTT